MPLILNTRWISILRRRFDEGRLDCYWTWHWRTDSIDSAAKYCDFSVFVPCKKRQRQLRPERVINDLETTMSTMPPITTFKCRSNITGEHNL